MFSLLGICLFQVVLEGVVGNGIRGDIAVDDLFFIDEEECQVKYGTG